MKEQDLEKQLDTEIEQAEASVEFWMEQARFLADSPMSERIESILAAHQSNMAELNAIREGWGDGED